MDLITIQCENASRLAEAHLQQAEAMGKLIDLYIEDFAAKNPQYGIQRLINGQSGRRLLN